MIPRPAGVRSGESLWQALATTARHPALPGALEVDVAVIGAGLTGLTCAVLLARGGVRVVVLEAREVAAGVTGCSSGQVTAQQGMVYAMLRRQHGADAARAQGRAHLAAVDRVRELVDAFGIDAGLRAIDSVVYATRPAQRVDLEEELQAAGALGMPAVWRDDVALPVRTHGAVAFTGQAQVQPVSLLGGLADALVGQLGGAVFEHTHVQRIERAGGRRRVVTDRGPVLADHVVQAAPLLIGNDGSFAPLGVPNAAAHPANTHSGLVHNTASRTHGIAARWDGPPLTAMFITADHPTRRVRHYSAEESWLVVVGTDAPADGRDAGRPDVDELARFAATTFDIGPVTHRWSIPVDVSGRRLPAVGDAGDPQVHLATGAGELGLTSGVVAAETAADRILSRGANPEPVVRPRRRILRSAAWQVPGHPHRTPQRPTLTHSMRPPEIEPSPGEAEIRYTVDHDTIRRWAGTRGLQPVVTAAGRLSLIDDASSSDPERSGWDDWLARFDRVGLALLYADSLDQPAGHVPFRLVPRER